MALFLEVLDGPQKGTRTKVFEGLLIGRREGDLTIRDSKLSGKHAKIELRPDGQLWLVDLGSANGIKSLDGVRVRELRLDIGSTFTLGRTSFRVFSPDSIEKDDAPTSAFEVTVTRTYWDNVRELANRAKSINRGSKRELAAFTPCLRLKITRGVQTGTEWVVGYGPRMVGTSSIDLHLEDPGLPPICFRLLPEDKGIRFKNESDKDVKLNGRWVENELLKNGDVIDIVNTRIQVVFDDGERK